MKKITLLIALIIFSVTTSFSQYKPDPLYPKRYSYKQLISRGYNVTPFKGKVFMTYDKYLEIRKTDTLLINRIEELADKYSTSSDTRELTISGILYSMLSIYHSGHERDLLWLIIEFNRAILSLPKPQLKADSPAKQINMPVIKVVSRSNNTNSHNVDFKATRKIYIPPAVTKTFFKDTVEWYRLDNGNTISKENYVRNWGEPIKTAVITDKKYKGETPDKSRVFR